MKECRFCGEQLSVDFADLGMSPLSNSFIKPEKLYSAETFLPLHAFVCSSCYLVQLEEFESPDHIFHDYAYFSSYSEEWLRHAEQYVYKMISDYSIGINSQVIEIASNDGYLLQYFKKYNIPVLGIEPAENVASVAIDKGIPTVCEFFGKKLAADLKGGGKQADLLLGNNVLAHVPDINNFVAGMKTLLKSNGIITLEFPHLLELIKNVQFDTIYHEHFSYLSLTSVNQIFQKHGLQLFDAEELLTHGGSLRIYVKHEEDCSKTVNRRVQSILDKEEEFGLKDMGVYREFGQRVKAVKRDILDFLIKAKNESKTIVGYGAPAKGNTLLNYCGIGKDFLDFTVDRSLYKQGLYLPGTHIPIYNPERILEFKPDYVLVLPWNLKEEIMSQLSFIRQWGGEFIIPIPKVMVV